MALATLALQLAPPVGAYVARSRTTYAVIRSTPQRVVVSEYDGALVTLVFDRASRHAGSPVQVVQSEDVTSGLYVMRVGPLSFDTPK